MSFIWPLTGLSNASRHAIVRAPWRRWGVKLTVIPDLGQHWLLPVYWLLLWESKGKFISLQLESQHWCVKGFPSKHPWLSYQYHICKAWHFISSIILLDKEVLVISQDYRHVCKLSAQMTTWIDNFFAICQCLSLLRYMIRATEKQKQANFNRGQQCGICKYWEKVWNLMVSFFMRFFFLTLTLISSHMHIINFLVIFTSHHPLFSPFLSTKILSLPDKSPYYFCVFFYLVFNDTKF